MFFNFISFKSLTLFCSYNNVQKKKNILLKYIKSLFVVYGGSNGVD